MRLLNMKKPKICSREPSLVSDFSETADALLTLETFKTRFKNDRTLSQLPQ